MSATYGNLNIANAWEAIADQIGDLPAISTLETSTTWKEFERNSASLARTFYEKLGMQEMPQWITCRLEGSKIDKLAASKK